MVKPHAQTARYKHPRQASSRLRFMELAPDDDAPSETPMPATTLDSNPTKEQSPAPRADADKYKPVKPLAPSDFVLGEVSSNAAYANTFATPIYGEVHDWAALMAEPNPEHSLPTASPELAAKLRKDLCLPEGKYKNMHILNAHITLAKTGRVATAWDVEKFAAWWDCRPVDFAMAPSEEELQQKKEAKEKQRLESSKQPTTEGLDFDAMFAEMNGTPAKPQTSVPASNAVSAVDSQARQHPAGLATSFAGPSTQGHAQPESAEKPVDIPQPWELEEAAARAAAKREQDRIAAEKARAKKNADQEDEQRRKAISGGSASEGIDIDALWKEINA